MKNANGECWVHGAWGLSVENIVNWSSRWLLPLIFIFLATERAILCRGPIQRLHGQATRLISTDDTSCF